MKCLSGIKNDYFEYNLLYSTFGKNTIESRINNLRPSFVEIAKSFNINSKYTVDYTNLFGIKNDIGIFCVANICTICQA